MKSGLFFLIVKEDPCHQLLSCFQSIHTKRFPERAVSIMYPHHQSVGKVSEVISA